MDAMPAIQGPVSSIGVSEPNASSQDDASASTAAEREEGEIPSEDVSQRKREEAEAAEAELKARLNLFCVLAVPVHLAYILAVCHKLQTICLKLGS